MSRAVWRKGAAGAAAVVAVLACVSSAGAAAAPPDSSITPAKCGPGSSPETALQGQIPKADRVSGRSAQGYHCNLRLIGQYQGEGSGVISPTYGDCAYFGSFFPISQFTSHPGVQVIDASDPRKPRAVRGLNSPAAIGGTWESLKVHRGRGLLASTGVEIPPGTGALTFDVYSVKEDCTNPKLLNKLAGSLSMPTPVIGHEGGFAPDGKTYYATSATGLVTAIDITDPAKPQALSVSSVGASNHGFSISPDGRTMYGVSVVPGGIQVLDISDIQDRKPSPQIRQIGQLTWEDGWFSQHTLNFTKGGHRYLFAVDEGGIGAVRLIDIDDPRNPRELRQYRLEIERPENTAARKADADFNGPFGYDAHYCSLNSQRDPTRLACSYWQSGVRLYDISNLMRPRELGYFDPPAQSGMMDRFRLRNSPHSLLSSPNFLDPSDLAVPNPSFTATTDYCSSPPEFKGPNELWVSCMDNGFLALRYVPPA